MSKIEVNAIEPQCGTTLTVGAAGTTVTVPSNVVKSNALQASDAGNIISQSGTTITLGATGDSINLASGATQSGFGRTGTVDWDTTPKTATFSAVSGNGYFCNTTAGVITVNLPAGSAGAIVSLADYAGTWQTYNVTVAPNGTDKIGSQNSNATLSTEGQSVTFVYVDSTQGWINTMDSTSNVRGLPPFVEATGGTITCCGDYKIHTFTGPGTFTVTDAGSPTGSNTVEYLVVAGGGGGALNHGGGGGGGFRFRAAPTNPQSGPGSPLNGPANLPVSIQAYPITVGGGGPAAPGPSPASGQRGSNSIFSSITSTGGGGGSNGPTVESPSPGGSGGGGGNAPSSTGGLGNTPPTSPAQGTNGGAAINIPGVCNTGGGGGGAIVAGAAGTSPYRGGPGGAGGGITGFGASNGECSGSVQYFAGGGGGASEPGRGPSYSVGGLGGGGNGRNADLGNPTGQPGDDNTGGGGGASGTPAGNGGSGIVVIRYKFQ